jgi:autophagy-related protein 101
VQTTNPSINAPPPPSSTHSLTHQPTNQPPFRLTGFRELTSRQTGILHTIFFHRFFPAIVPQTRDVLDVTLPYVDDDELETMIEQRASALERRLDAERSSSNNPSAASGGGGGRGQVAVQFFEKRRRKAWLSRGDDEVCWECWTVKVTVAEPRTENGTPLPLLRLRWNIAC